MHTSTAFSRITWSAFYRKLRSIGRLVRLGMSKTGNAAFWREIFVRYLWQRPFWFTDKYGVTLRLYPEDSLQTILVTRLHFDDEPVLQLTKQLIKPGMTVVDVGANHGQFTVFAAQLVGDNGQVHAFEPTSYSFQRLSENVRRIDSLVHGVHLNQNAVGNQNGHAVIYEFPPGCSAWNSLSPHTMYSPGKAIAPSQTENVPIITLDKYCSNHKIERIDLLKVDVEGFEVEVLEGCKCLIKKRHIRNVIFEISLDPLKGTNRTPTSVLRAIFEMGFDIQRIHPNGDLEPVLLSQFKVPYFANYLAIPRSN